MNPYFSADGIDLYHGDCRDVLPVLDIDPVPLVFTSPPYNCGMGYGVGGDALPLPAYFDLIESAMHAATNKLRAGGYLIANVPSWIGSREEQVFAFDEHRAILDRCLPFEDLIVWAKQPPNGTAWGNFATSPRIRANHEWLIVQRAPGKATERSEITWDEWSRLTQSVWQINATLPDRDVHPATMPRELVRRVLLLYSPAGGTVLDPFAGIGTTLRTAKSMGRKAIGIEIEERYCEIAARALSQCSFDFGGAA